MRDQPLAARLGSLYLPLLLALAAAATWALYLGYAALLPTPLGFPLDDSWIHQTFARNLAQTHGFYYNPGEPSTASTAPLWTVMLAVGYWLPVDFRLWAYVLGLLSLGLIAWTVRQLTRLLFPGRPGLALAAALGTALEWHLAWAGLSGMETLLFTLLALVLLWLALADGVSALLLGVVGGMATLARPEGMILFGLVLTARALREWGKGTGGNRENERGSVSRGIIGVLRLGVPALATFGLLLAPYLVFNYTITGQPLPSTFYAKHAAYGSALVPAALFGYLLRAALEVFSGPLLMLAPGLVYGVAAGLGRLPRTGIHKAAAGLPILWLIALPALYALRLPATYHHGRYLMALIPLLVLYGLWGTGELLRALPLRLLARIYTLLVMAFWLVMWGNGAVVYSWDVRFINEQEVAVGQWLRDHTAADSLIATHDVGAIAYFSSRRLVDTAGLVTPELAPFVRDQRRILDYLVAQQVDYVAIFPRWYPEIVADHRLEEVFRLRHEYAREQGADNMVVQQAHWTR